MHSLLNVVAIATFAGVIGTAGGGFLVALIPRPSNRLTGLFLGLSGGIMLSITFLDLIPEALATGFISSSFFGIIAGMALILSLDYLLPHIHYSSDSKDCHFKKVGILLGISIAMHNIPEGFAIGTGFSAEIKLGASLAFIMALHNLPEGLAMGTMLKCSNTTPGSIIAATALAGLPTGIGALGGHLLGDISAASLAWALGLAAGAMLYITFSELLPDAYSLGERSSASKGIILGVLVALVLTITL